MWRWRFVLEAAQRTATKDADGDRVVTAAELQSWDNHVKLTTQQRIAVGAFSFMVLLTIANYMPPNPKSRVAAMSPLISTMYLSLCGAVMAYFGAAALMAKKK